MTGDVAVRRMEAADVDAVAGLEASIFTMPWSAQGFRDSISLGNTVFLVAETGEDIVGYAGMYLSVDEGEITNVAVASGYRCHGIGGMLLKALVDEAGKQGVARLVLEVRVSNAPAIRLYESHGFRNGGLRKHFYRCPDEDAYIMLYGQ